MVEIISEYWPWIESLLPLVAVYFGGIATPIFIFEWKTFRKKQLEKKRQKQNYLKKIHDLAQQTKQAWENYEVWLIHSIKINESSDSLTDLLQECTKIRNPAGIDVPEIILDKIKDTEHAIFSFLEFHSQPGSPQFLQQGKQIFQEAEKLQNEINKFIK